LIGGKVWQEVFVRVPVVKEGYSAAMGFGCDWDWQDSGFEVNMPSVKPKAGSCKRRKLQYRRARVFI
jgi:hypothetical protein